VEDHIRGVVKDLLRSRGIVHHGLETDINGAKQIPWKGLKYRLSLQVGRSTYMLSCLSLNYCNALSVKGQRERID
jgi:hypothetical protein